MKNLALKKRPRLWPALWGFGTGVLLYLLVDDLLPVLDYRPTVGDGLYMAILTGVTAGVAIETIHVGRAVSRMIAGIALAVVAVLCVGAVLEAFRNGDVIVQGWSRYLFG